MGGRIWRKPARQTAREAVEVNGIFWPNGTGTVSDTAGNWFSVARTAAGLFTIELADGINPPVCVGAICCLSKASGADLGVEFYDSWDPVTKTIKIRMATAAGVDTDLAADADNWVSFSLKFALNSDY